VSRFSRSRDVFGIRGDQGSGVVANGLCHRQQRAVLDTGGGPCHVARRRARRRADALHVGADVRERAETGDGEIAHRSIVARSQCGSGRPPLAAGIEPERRRKTTHKN
jgi:hypothetical protein